MIKPVPHIFIGIKAKDMEIALKQCEEFSGLKYRCSNGTFFGGDHCDASVGGYSFSLRLNHFDDGDGYRWCIPNSSYTWVLSCTCYSSDNLDRLLEKVASLDLFEVVQGSITR